MLQHNDAERRPLIWREARSVPRGAGSPIVGAIGSRNEGSGEMDVHRGVSNAVGSSDPRFEPAGG